MFGLSSGDELGAPSRRAGETEEAEPAPTRAGEAEPGASRVEPSRAKPSGPSKCVSVLLVPFVQLAANGILLKDLQKLCLEILLSVLLQVKKLKKI